MKIRRKKRQSLVIPMTSFGDIAFLLIIFFMVASVFMRESHIKVTPAKSPDVDKAKVRISVVMDSEGKVWVDGEQCPVDSLESVVAAMLQDRSDKTVTLKIDKDRLQKEYGSVIKSIADAGSDVVLFGEKEGK